MLFAYRSSFRRGRGITGTTSILPDGLGYGRHSFNDFNKVIIFGEETQNIEKTDGDCFAPRLGDRAIRRMPS